LEVLPASDDDYSDEESESGEESEGDDEEYVQRPARKRARKGIITCAILFKHGICDSGLLVLRVCMNPVVPNIGMADPHVHVFDGKFFMYATHVFSANNTRASFVGKLCQRSSFRIVCETRSTGYKMVNLWIFSSADLVSWQQEDILLHSDTPAPQSEWSECWATDGAERGGPYYFYISMGPDEVPCVLSVT
jgi:arabinoxylan arabinofuranohydrolase